MLCAVEINFFPIHSPLLAGLAADSRFRLLIICSRIRFGPSKAASFQHSQHQLQDAKSSRAEACLIEPGDASREASLCDRKISRIASSRSGGCTEETNRRKADHGEEDYSTRKTRETFAKLVAACPIRYYKLNNAAHAKRRRTRCVWHRHPKVGWRLQQTEILSSLSLLLLSGFAFLFLSRRHVSVRSLRCL